MIGMLAVISLLVFPEPYGSGVKDTAGLIECDNADLKFNLLIKYQIIQFPFLQPQKCEKQFNRHHISPSGAPSMFNLAIDDTE